MTHRNVYDIKKEDNLNFFLPEERRIGREKEDVPTVVVLVHVHYPDSLDTYQAYLDALPAYVHLLVTSSSQPLLRDAKKRLRDKPYSWELVEKDNRGRDISALLVAARERILEYDYVCFLHDKKSRGPAYLLDTEKMIFSLWHNTLASSAYVENILDVFQRNPRLGMLFPPDIVGERHTFVYDNTWYVNYQNTVTLAQWLGLRCDLNPKKKPIAMGTVFWARVKAIRRLLEREWRYEDFPQEPLPVDGALNHAMERILPFVAQDAGYDSGTVMTTGYAGRYVTDLQEALQETFDVLRHDNRIAFLGDVRRRRNQIREAEECRRDLSLPPKAKNPVEGRRIILYGMGRVYRRYARELQSRFDVVAFCDKDTFLQDVITPQEIAGLEYDYVVICTWPYFKEIKGALIGCHGVPADKIFSYRLFIEQDDELRARNRKEQGEVILNIIRDMGWQRAMDTEGSPLSMICLGTEEIAHMTEPFYVVDTEKGFFNLYQSQPDNGKLLDGGLIWDIEKMDKNTIKKMVAGCRILLAWRNHMDKLSTVEADREFFSGLGCEVMAISHMCGMLYIVHCHFLKELLTGKLRVVVHKEYSIQRDQLYEPICVAGYRHIGWGNDVEGENISWLNEKINECTALYWLWKNDRSEFAGISHYRRYLCNPGIDEYENRITRATITELLQEYDVLLAYPEVHMEKTMGKLLRDLLQPGVYEKGFAIVEEALRRHQPDYHERFLEVLDGHLMYICNMFVTRKEIFDEYCTWLFSFLIEAAEQMDVSEYNAYSKRVIGFFAERMLTVWLTRQPLKIKELPYVLLSERI